MHKQKGSIKCKWMKGTLDVPDGTIKQVPSDDHTISRGNPSTTRNFNGVFKIDCHKKQKNADYETSGKKTVVKRMYKISACEGPRGQKNCNTMKKHFLAAINKVMAYHMERRAKKGKTNVGMM